jgi:ABC-type multidrug transport system fused ATPase/permease subunit
LIFLLTVALLVALGFLVQWYFTSNLSITDRKALVQGLASAAQALAVFLTGVAGLIGLFFTWRNLRQTREHSERQLAQAQESTEHTMRLTEQGQITERFTRAIEHLGSEKLEIRLGGIYALERIDRDSEKDHWSIV